MAKTRPHTRARTIDDRFDEVTQAFVEHRDFTLFCFDKLQESTDAQFKGVRAEMKAFQEHTAAEFKSVRAELREFKDESRAEFTAVRAELKAVEGRLNRRLDVHEVLLTEVLREVKALRPR